jgi:hypothetical protein
LFELIECLVVDTVELIECFEFQGSMADTSQEPIEMLEPIEVCGDEEMLERICRCEVDYNFAPKNAEKPRRKSSSSKTAKNLMRNSQSSSAGSQRSSHIEFGQSGSQSPGQKRAVSGNTKRNTNGIVENAAVGSFGKEAVEGLGKDSKEVVQSSQKHGGRRRVFSKAAVADGASGEHCNEQDGNAGDITGDVSVASSGFESFAETVSSLADSLSEVSLKVHESSRPSSEMSLKVYEASPHSKMSDAATPASTSSSSRVSEAATASRSQSVNTVNTNTPTNTNNYTDSSSISFIDSVNHSRTNSLNDSRTFSNIDSLSPHYDSLNGPSPVASPSGRHPSFSLPKSSSPVASDSTTGRRRHPSFGLPTARVRARPEIGNGAIVSGEVALAGNGTTVVGYARGSRSGGTSGPLALSNRADHLQDLMRKLLKQKPSERLGYNDITEVAEHQYFRK